LKFPFRGKARSGEYQDFRPSTQYAVSHSVQVWTREGAEALADLLHGRFDASYAPDSYDTLARGLWVVTLKHTGIPDKNTIRKARKAIEEAIEEVGANARYQGWSRTELGPAETPRRPWLHDDGDDGDSDSPMGIPLPLKS
jgi:hypothetical protein